MRLLYLSTDPGVPVLGHKGASVHLRAMVSALAATGAEVIVASPRIADEGERLDGAAALVGVTPVLPKTAPDERALGDMISRQADEIAALATEFGVDAVYERLALFSNGGVGAAASLGLPHVLEVNAPLSVEAARFRTLPHPEVALALEAEVLEGTGRVLAVSQALASLLAAAGVNEAKIDVVPNGIDAEACASLTPWRGRQVTVGFAGSLKPWHGVDVLLAGFAAALREAPDLRLEIVGSGPMAELVRTSGLAPGVLLYRGQISHHETLRAIAGWDAALAPYPPLEDFYFSPLKVGEYMACGACPIASDLPVLRQLLGGGSRGILVEPGNPAALTAALAAVAADRDHAGLLGRRAREHALASLGWKHNAAAALSALQLTSAGIMS